MNQLIQTPAASNRAIFDRIYQDIQEDVGNLPSLPDIAIRVRKAIHDPNKKTADIAKIIQADLSLAAHIVQVANSPFYYRGRAVDSLPAAISRMGLETTRNMAMSHMMKSMYCRQSKSTKSILQDIWRQSIKTAAISYVLAARTRKARPDSALLAGLLLDVGALPLITMAEVTPGFSCNRESIDILVAEYASAVGVLMLQQWQFDEALVEVLRQRENWLRDESDEADMVDVVMIARLHSYIGTPKFRQCPRLDQVPAFHKMPLGELTPENSLAMLEDAREEIADVERLLQGH